MGKVKVTALLDWNDRINSTLRRKDTEFELEESHAKEEAGKGTVKISKPEKKAEKKPQDITMDKIQKDTEEAGEKNVGNPVEKVKPTITAKAQRTGKSGQIKSTKPAKISKTKGGRRGK